MQASLDFGVLLNMAFRAFKLRLHQHLRERGFSDVGPSDGYILRTLHGAGLNLKELSEVLGLTPQGTLKIVNDMVLRGYLVKRGDDSDARVRRFDLTPKALSLMEEAHRFHQSFEEDLRRQLGRQRAKAARELLEAIVANSVRPNDPSRWEVV